MRKMLLACAAGVALLAGAGCEPEKIKVEGTSGSPPPQDSQADKNAPQKPGAPGGPVGPTEPPKGGGPAGPPKRGGKPMG